MGQERVQDLVVPDAVSYQPPRVERVLTPQELEREVLYAGLLVSPCPPAGTADCPFT